MKVFGYLRVSSAGQLEGDGFDRQRDAIQKFCDKRGWTIYAWYEEPISGTVEGFDRPKFADMMSVAGPGTAQAVVVEAAHRLARDLMVSELLLNEARKLDVRVFEAAAGQELTDDKDPTRVLLRQFLGAISQWDKSNTVRRLAAARNRLRAQGEFMGGHTPWEQTHKVSADHIVSLRKSNYTLDEIRCFLIRHKIPTPMGEHYSRWQKSTIALIVKRMTVAGTLPPLERRKTVDLEYIKI